MEYDTRSRRFDATIEIAAGTAQAIGDAPRRTRCPDGRSRDRDARTIERGNIIKEADM